MERVAEKTVELLTSKLGIFKAERRRIFATSSFQTQSVPLLHIIGKFFADIEILLLDTGFLFPETYIFKDELAKLFGLKIITLQSSTTLLQQLDKSRELFQYSLDPDYCCHLNKVKPLKDFLRPGDVWISGVRRDQTSLRNKMDVVEYDDGVIKFHPILDWTRKDTHYYIEDNSLPRHPLEQEGYVSIGCMPCTYKWSGGEERGGRWAGRKKMECGLHTKK